MGEIISSRKLLKVIKELKDFGKKIVLAGGCFDVLHPGHVVFLEKAKNSGDILIVLLESDEKVKLLKGSSRPFHNQKERAQVLSALKSVDYLIMLPFMESDQKYDQLIEKIKPDVIAATSSEANIKYLKRAANLTGAKLKFVTKMIGNYSTSRILDH